jgi:hypothetical protein
VRGGVSPTVARKQRASVARETPVAAASDSTVHERDLRTNYLGTRRVIHAFVRALEHNAPAAVVNVLVLVALEPMGPAFLDYGRGGNRPEAPAGTQKPPSVREEEDFLELTVVLPGDQSQSGRTCSACGPFWPCVMSNSTRWFSSRLR